MLDASLRIQSRCFAQMEKISAISQRLRGSDHVNALIYYQPPAPEEAGLTQAHPDSAKIRKRTWARDRPDRTMRDHLVPRVR